MTLRARIRFYQQMAVLTRAGLPIRSSIERLRDRLGGNQLAVLAQKLSEGERLADSFATAGFPPFETNLIAAGERSARSNRSAPHARSSAVTSSPAMMPK